MKKRQIDAALQSTKHSLETDGFQVTKEQEELVKKQLQSELTEEQFLEEVRKRIKQKEK
ncbi:antitoxin VbhA family protein [Bacillus cereus group sp. BfR-BA-01495]|uniref:antitoxin VbhA family protein n=1 Tax=Bacillus cereus group sp. BfR-BA-01495 TaxID=2920363 RepID=UPI001F5A8D59|nr:antitoxin VbhA family protein [Bacillus cereus group sp. BfR-BA-01495]